jgi:ribonuclease HI
LTWRTNGEYTARVSGSLLLASGQESIQLYADASYADELSAGAWAFSVPAFSLMTAGIEVGGSVNRVELSAVVRGLLLTTALDHSDRRIHVHTDSDFVVRIMQCAADRTQLPGRKSFLAVADLYAQACDLTSRRVLLTSRRSIGDPHHAACDSAAKKELRTYCSNGKFAGTILLKRAEARRTGILNEIRQLESSFEKLHRRLLTCEMEIGALRTANDQSMVST